MKRTFTVLIAITLLLFVMSSNSSKLNSSPTSEPQENVETLEDQEIVKTEKTENVQIQEENSETKTCPSQNFNEEDLQEGENSNTVNYDENVVPPDGRIYYPTSPESPYAYIPTNTPKGWDMPIAPPEQES